MGAQMLLVTCTKRYVETLMEEFVDWFLSIPDAQVVLYGITNKEQVGFILIKYMSPLPKPFTDKLRTDSDVIDYVHYDGTHHT